MLDRGWGRSDYRSRTNLNVKVLWLSDQFRGIPRKRVAEQAHYRLKDAMDQGVAASQVVFSHSPGSLGRARCSWVPVVPETPASRWMWPGYAGPLELQILGLSTGADGWYRCSRKSGAMTEVCLYGTAPATGK